MKKLIPLVLLTLFSVSSALAQDAASSPTPGASPSPSKHKHSKKAAVTAASPGSPATGTASQSAAAPGATSTPAPGGGPGMVWVNTSSHVYHKEGSRFYGKTKHGKYMTEADAIKEGDHAAKEVSK